MTGIYISSLFFLIFLARVNCLRPGGKNVKTSYQRYYVYEQTSVKVRKTRRTCTQTCDKHFVICWSHKTVCRNVDYYVWSWRNKRVAKTKPYYSCYSGWRSKYGYECTIPICTGGCQHGGSCTYPNTCRCTSGWTGSRCRSDIDECRSSRNRCSYKPGCRNTQGSYRCTCKVGYYLSSDQRTCRDIDECRSGGNSCSYKPGCHNTQGSYRCTCGIGYHLASDQRICRDVNECIPTSGIIHGCKGTCHNLDGSYKCSCPTGHYLATNGRDCTDRDECEANTDDCQQQCVNYPGSYNCTCYPGYRRRKTSYKLCEDINECADNTAGCAQICTNHIGSFNCSCQQGFYLGTDSKSCNDFDECSTDTHNSCQHNCLNTYGSYHCTCRPGFDLLQDGRNCLGRPCIPIYTPVNGIKNCSGYSTEHICHFMCSPGYNLIRSRNRTCSSSKVWTGEETKCKIIHYPTPTEPNNGFVYSPCETQFEAQCTVGSSHGYYINGTNKITCDANGAWQPGHLTCREIKVCQPNPCLHGGICSTVSSDHYSCDCTNTGYRGTDCDVGSIITPDFPTLTDGVPSRPLMFQVSPPSDSITLTLTSRSLEFNPSRLIFQKGGSRHQSLTITAQRPGLYFIRYSLSGESAGEFQSPQADAIFVRSKYSTTETPDNEPPSKIPSGCHKQKLNKCPISNDVITAASTLPWVTFGPLTTTKGVVNIEVGATTVPLSLVGTNLPNANQVSAPDQCSENEGGGSSEQFIKSRILVKSFLNAVNESLPNWLSISLRNNSSAGKISLSELTTRYLTGKHLQDADVGEGQPTRDESFYSLLSSQNLNLTIDNDVDLLGSRDHNFPLSLAIDLCGPAPKTVIVRPSLEDMDVVNDNSVVKNLRENGWNVTFYSLQISMKNLIEKLPKGQFWNGERFFEVDASKNGNLAMVSSFNKSFKSTSFMNSGVEFQGTIVTEVGNIENILEKPLDQEWNADLYGNIVLTTEFKVKGKMTKVTVKAPQSIGYASFGGSKQKGCHTDANYDPQGLFLTATLQEDPFVHSELNRFVELGSNKTLACYLDTVIHTNKGSQLSKYAERNDAVSMAFHGHIKFGPLRFQDLDTQLDIRNSYCSKTTNSPPNTGIVLSGEHIEIRQRKFGIFESTAGLAINLRIHVALDKDSNSTGSFQSIAQILGFKKLTNISFSDKGLDFAVNGKVHSLFDASMKCSSSLAAWAGQIFTVAGQFEDNSVRGSNLKDFLEATLNRYALQVLKKATSREAAVKETEQRAKGRLENVLLIKNAAMAKIQGIRKEYVMVERGLASARKNLAHFEQVAKKYSGDVDALKEDLDGLCEVKECPDVCQEGVVCTTCYDDVIGKTMGMCPATCLKTEQRRLAPYTEVVLCERQKCTRIHNTNGLFKKIFGNLFGKIVKVALSFGITAIATVLGVPPPLASALGSGLVTMLDTGRVDEALCSIVKGAVTSFIGGPGAKRVFKELGKVSAREAVKIGGVALGRHGASFLVGKLISCQREQRDGYWRCRVVAVQCTKGRFQYEYEHTPYGCKKSCEIERITKTIEKSCCSNLPCASFIVNITCVAENALCTQARKVALDQISKTKADAANILKNLESARQNFSYWKIKKQKEYIKLVSASRSLNASQDAVRSLERAYNVTVGARRRKLEILAKPLKLRSLFDEHQESLVMVKIEDIKFEVRVAAGRESTLLPIYIMFMANGSRETLSTILDFKRLNASLRSIAKEILSSSVGDLSSVSRKRRSVEDHARDSIGSDQRFLALKNYHRLCSEFTNYEQTLYDVVSSLQNLSSEVRRLQQNLRNRNESSSFNISDVLTRFSVNKTMALKLGVNVPGNVSLLIDHLNTDPELSEANDLEQEATKDSREPLRLTAKLLVYNWYAIMEDIFNESSIANECSGLEDCLKYTIDNLYEIYAEIDLPRAPHVREHIKAIETELAELTRSVGMSVDDAVEISSEILRILDDMAKVNEVCASPPNITKHPEAFTEMGVGKTLSMTCNATGSALVYKWRFNGEFLQDQSSNTLLIKNTTVSHSGDYTCEISNHITTDTSIPAHVIVHRPPSIIVQPVGHLSVALSNDASLECLTESKDRNITYQWWFKSVNSTSFLALKTETFSYINFAPLTATHEGWYFCKVSNGYASRISRTSFVKALYFSLPVPAATLSLSVIRMVQENETVAKKLNASSYRDIRSRISELFSSFGNLSTASPIIRNLHPVTCKLRNSRSNKTRDNDEVCQWQFHYVGENATSNSSVNDEFEVNARKVINASLDVKQDIGKLVNATNNGYLLFLLDNKTYFVEKHSLSVQNFFLHCPQRQTLVQKDFKCVDCPPGSYGKLNDNGIASCQFCPLGSYQTNSGQPSCVKCPKGFSTIYQGSYGKDECKVICQAGHYGIITKNIGQCLVCPVNSYQPMEGQFACLACPGGHVTNTNGTTDVTKCILGPTTQKPENRKTVMSSKSSPVMTEVTRVPTRSHLKKTESEASNVGLIVGVVAAIIVLALIGVLLLYACRRRQQNKKPNQHQADEQEPPSTIKESSSSDWRFNKAYTSDEAVGDFARENPIYDTTWCPSPPPNKCLSFDNLTHDDIVASEGITPSVHSYGNITVFKGLSFESPLFVELNDDEDV